MLLLAGLLAGVTDGIFVVVAVVSIVIVFTWFVPRFIRQSRLKQGCHAFGEQREQLEKDFLGFAGRTGIPRGLIWVRCDFETEVCFVRERTTGQLQSLVPVTIAFEAEVGGGMEEVEAVGNLRAATAVFLYDGDSWSTEGRVVFNLNPQQTVEHHQESLEIVEPAR
jgi:hypothetical protein